MLSRGKKLRVESLENRTVLTGNVTAVVSHGSLVVTGDAADNGITITQVDSDSFQIAGDASTTINGQSLGTPVVLDGIAKNVLVDMKSGNDSVSLDGLSIQRNLVVNGGSGNDEIALTDVFVRLNTVLRGGAGNDDISANQVDTGATLLIDAGKGNNSIDVSESEGVVLLINARKNSDVVTKTGNDFDVTLQPSFTLKAKVADKVFAAWERAFARIV